MNNSPWTLDPAISMYINIIVSVVGGLSTAGATLTDLFGTGPAQKIIAGAGLASLVFGSVNAALHGYSPPTAGPGA